MLLSASIPALHAVFGDPFGPLVFACLEFFEQFEGYLHVVRAAALGRPLPAENRVRIDVQSLIDSASAQAE